MAEDRKVMLYSGGLDSFCMLSIVDPDVVVFFKTGTEDNVLEYENLMKLAKSGYFADKATELFVVDLPIKGAEIGNKIIPHRNTIFCLLASNYGNHIYIGCTSGDTTKDKDYVWKSQVEGLLNYFALDSHKVWQKGYPYEIIMPFKELSKAEILKIFLNKNGNIYDVINYSRSCYRIGREGKECGDCRSCLRKAVALEIHGIHWEELFFQDPFQTMSFNDYQKMVSRGKEGSELAMACNMYEKRTGSKLIGFETGGKKK